MADNYTVTMTPFLSAGTKFELVDQTSQMCDDFSYQMQNDESIARRNVLRNLAPDF